MSGELVEILKALADETRVRILNLLKDGELCVCELEILLGLNQSNASRHLNKLRSAKIIAYEKRAQWVYYRLRKDTLALYPFLAELLKNETEKLPVCQIDQARLLKYKQSGITCDELKEGKLTFEDIG